MANQKVIKNGSGGSRRLIILFIMALILLLTAQVAFCKFPKQHPLARQDKNHDGKISKSEFRGPPKAFQKMDANHDGFVTFDEFKRAKQDKGHQMSAPGSGHGGSSGEDQYVAATKYKMGYIDTHNHLAGWVGSQRHTSDGFASAANAALAVMDQLGINTMILMPTPQTVNQKNQHDIDDYKSIVKRYPGRFAMLAGGGTLNIMIQEAVSKGSVTNAMKSQFEKQAETLLDQGALGFGEMTAEHLSMNPTHPYVAVQPDHELFLVLADIAAKHDVPLDIHMEAVPYDMPLPQRLKKMRNNPDTLKANINAFERLLSHNPKAKIIWVHAGWDNTGKWTCELSNRLLNKYPNLYMSIRVVPKNIPSRPLDESNQIKKEWLELVVTHQDRFIIGSDQFYMPQTGGQGHPSKDSSKKTIEFVSKLPEDVAKKVGYENAISLFKLKQR